MFFSSPDSERDLELNEKEMPNTRAQREVSFCAFVMVAWPNEVWPYKLLVISPSLPLPTCTHWMLSKLPPCRTAKGC